jgi:3'-phosphoadenosine 5'-phosphosulfate sulfotransferase (PAPS reductase)/FAD synthetase
MTQAHLSADMSPIPALADYDRFLVAFSGGKDSVACVLHLLEQLTQLGISHSKVELHHHLVDGREGSTLMDWPVTEDYCVKFAAAFNLKLTFSWKKHGFEGEMNRHDMPTAPSMVPLLSAGSEVYQPIGGRGPQGTRLKFPQVSASLSTRWCSAYLKIGLMDAYIINNPHFEHGRTCVITGERAEESKSRANYKSFESHRSDNRHGARVKRHVDHWRPVHGWLEEKVWAIMERYKVAAHPAYFLSWGRMSCRCCIFGSNNQWATVRMIAKPQFDVIASYERKFGVTIGRKESIEQRADKGAPYLTDPAMVAIGNSTEYSMPIIMAEWRLPSGAFGENCGPV